MKKFAFSSSCWAQGESVVTTQLGDAFLFGLHSHLWIVISEPAKHAGNFVIVNLTTDVFRAGKECELGLGDHEWIIQKCYVSFGRCAKS